MTLGACDERKHNNILKRLLVHVAGMNLGLLLRSAYGIGTPRGLQGLSYALDFLVALIAQAVISENSQFTGAGVTGQRLETSLYQLLLCVQFSLSEIQKQTSTPDC